MSKKKIFVLLGHPDYETLCGKLADAYEVAALEAGHEVRRMNVGEMQFDPILHKGYKVIQALEPDLETFQRNVSWCDHLVVLYPNWWCTMPALLKGLFDRAWLPGFAFRFHKKNGGWDKLLAGKTGRIIITAATSGWFTRLHFGDFTNELRKGTLQFAGINPVTVKLFAPAEKAPEAEKLRWIQEVKKMGERAL